MPTFATGYVKPGTYLQEQNVSQPSAPAIVHVFAPVGEGAKTAPRQQTLVKGVSGGQDGPLNDNVVIQLTQVQDSNGIIYTQGVDYQLTRPTPTSTVVDWSLLASLVGTVQLSSILPDLSALNGQALNVIVNGGANQTIVFSGFTNATTPAQVATFINQWSAALNNAASINAGGYLVLSAKSVQMQPGSASAILGLLSPTGGQYLSASVREVPTGVSYTVNYTSDKQASEYTAMLWDDPTDLQNWYGLPEPQTVYATGTATSATTGSEPFTLTDTTQNWVPNAFVGYYVRITGGHGIGQVRVIIANTANTITLSQDWEALSAPNSTSTYTITNVNNNSISVAALAAFGTGATVVIASQFADDIYSTTQIQAAINALATKIAGQYAYCIVYANGLASTDLQIIGYLKNFVQNQSNVLTDQWSMAVVGLAAGNDVANTFVSIAESTNSNRVVLLANTSITANFGYGLMNLDGGAFAAAHGGIICANEMAATPLSGRSISGAGFNISSYSDSFNETEKNLMAAAGVTIYESTGVDMLCRDALNTSGIALGNNTLATDTVNTRNMDFISQFIAVSLDVLVDTLFDTNPNQGGPISRGYTIMSFCSSTLLAAGNITQPFQNVQLNQDAENPYQIDVNAIISLTPTLKWIYILAGYNIG